MRSAAFLLALAVGVALVGCDSDEISSTGATKAETSCTVNGQPC